MNSSQTSLGIEQYWQIVKRRWLPGSVVFFSVLTLGVVATSLKENIYEAEAKLKFKSNTISSSLTEVSRTLNAFAPIAEQGNPIDTEAEVLQSVPLIKKTIDDPDLQLKNSEGEKLSVSDFRARLKVGSIAATDILEVSYLSQNPEQAAKVVNTLVKNYLENNLVVNKAEAVSAREFLEEQLPKVEKSLRKTEAAVRELKESNEYVAPQEDTRALIEGLRSLQAEIAQARGEMANADSRANYIREKLGLTSQQAVILTTIGQAPEVRETIGKLQNAESELAIVQARFKPNSPNVVELQEQVNSLEKLLESQTIAIGGEEARDIIKNIKTGEIQEQLTSELIELEAANFGLRKQIESLSEIERERRNRIEKIPQLEQQLSQLNRRLQSYESNYNVLSQQLQTVRIAESQDPGNVRVISNAVVPNQPVSSRSVGYLASGSLALLATAGAVYLLEISDKSIKTIEEAKQIYGYSWLGVIPSIDKLETLKLPNGADSSVPKIAVRDYPSLPLSESYRMLQSNIKFLNSDRPTESIVITSSAAEEGKSTVAANLAASMTRAGNRVLLVDTNLHHPMQHQIWNVDNHSGLSNVIADRLDPRTSVAEVMPNLDLLTSGTLTPSPANLLDSQRMKMLMDYWSERYDFVIFDTPSLDFTADALIMGRLADGVLLVVRPGSEERAQAIFTKEILDQSGVNMLGIVFNGVGSQFDSRPYYPPSIQEEPSITKLERLVETSEKEALWDTISTLARESKKDRLANNLDESELQLAPIEKLESMVHYLQQDLLDLERLVKEQEDELSMQRLKVTRIQSKAKQTSKNELFSMENQLKQEQERKEMLDETLIGQRRNLAKRREMLYQYQQVLDARKNSSSRVSS